jgi:hypothetical protein
MMVKNILGKGEYPSLGSYELEFSSEKVDGVVNFHAQPRGN